MDKKYYLKSIFKIIKKDNNFFLENLQNCAK